MENRASRMSKKTRSLVRLSPIVGLALILALAVAVLYGAPVLASVLAGESIPWQVIAGGGGSASGGNITLDSTLGQPIAGPSGGGSAWLDAGYWYGEQPVLLFLPLVQR